MTYGELEDEPASETNHGIVFPPIEEASQFPLVTRLRKRKEMVERQPKPQVYSKKPLKGESLKRSRTLGGLTTIQEDPLHEGEELEVEQTKYPLLPPLLQPLLPLMLLLLLPLRLLLRKWLLLPR